MCHHCIGLFATPIDRNGIDDIFYYYFRAIQTYMCRNPCWLDPKSTCKVSVSSIYYILLSIRASSPFTHVQLVTCATTNLETIDVEIKWILTPKLCLPEQSDNDDVSDSHIYINSAKMFIWLVLFSLISRKTLCPSCRTNPSRWCPNPNNICVATTIT